MKTKLIGIIICMLLIGTVLPVTGTSLIDKTTTCNVSGNILYVGGSGAGNYTSIQEAINDASDGDTVFVYNGTYYENILVNKSINLTGESRNITIIDGNGTSDVVRLSAGQINISGFTIQNSGESEGYLDFDAGIDVHSNNNIITGNNIINNRRDGIFTRRKCKNTLIKGNIISSNNYYGIHNPYLMENNIIQDNIISNNNEAGIYGYNVVNTLIIGNIITNHSDTFPSTPPGIELWRNKQSVIKRNIITNNCLGIYLVNVYDNAEFEGCKVLGNNISNNRFGIHVVDSIRHTIARNNFFNNHMENYGFYLDFEWMIAGPTILSHNYWDKPRISPYIIWALLPTQFPPRFIIWCQIDWHPAQEPYDIDDDIISRINTYNR